MTQQQLATRLQTSHPGFIRTLKELHEGGMDHVTILRACCLYGVKQHSLVYATIQSLLKRWKHS